MTQNNRERDEMNSAFEKLRIASHEIDKNISEELDILKPKNLQVIHQICEKKKRRDSLYDFIVRTCATNISKELTELVIEKLITQNAKSNKETVQGLNSFYKLNEKQVSIPNANSFMEISESQPNTSDNEILEPLEEGSRGFHETLSNTIIDIKTPTLAEFLSSETLETSQDVII